MPAESPSPATGPASRPAGRSPKGPAGELPDAGQLPEGRPDAQQGSRPANGERAGARARQRPGNRPQPGPRVRRDRHGRGLRRPLLPRAVPGSTSKAERFDEAVLRAVAELEDLWGDRLAVIEFAVDEVPPLPAGEVVPTSDVVLDAGVPLARFAPPGVDRRGRPTRARIVIYRRPVESRALDADDLADLIVEVLTEQVASVFGDPDDPAQN